MGLAAGRRPVGGSQRTLCDRLVRTAHSCPVALLSEAPAVETERADRLASDADLVVPSALGALSVATHISADERIAVIGCCCRLSRTRRCDDTTGRQEQRDASQRQHSRHAFHDETFPIDVKVWRICHPSIVVKRKLLVNVVICVVAGKSVGYIAKAAIAVFSPYLLGIQGVYA